MTALAMVLGLGIGSLPTADLIARLRGIDLRTEGTGNPGARNALATGGAALGVAVLAAELLKGSGAVVVGRLLGGDPGAALAAVGAVAGNVYNPWYGFDGGKGLGISAGVMAAMWPPGGVAAALALASTTARTRRSGPAALVGFAVLVVAALVGLWRPLPTWWGLAAPGWIVVGAAGIVAVMLPKHLTDAITPDDRPPSPS